MHEEPFFRCIGQGRVYRATQEACSNRPIKALWPQARADGTEAQPADTRGDRRAFEVATARRGQTWIGQLAGSGLASCPRCRRASHILCKCGPLRQSPCCGSPLVLKTKILLFLQLFLRLRILARLQKSETGRQAIYLMRFCDVVDIQKSRNNPQSQKSCRKAGNFVFALPKRRY